MPFGGAVVNRMNDAAPWRASEPDERELAALLGDELGRKVARNLDDYQALATARPGEREAPRPRAAASEAADPRAPASTTTCTTSPASWR